jgi:hypothetical protein
MVNTKTKKHPDYFVIVDVDAGFMNKTEVITCSNFNSAVNMYRKMSDMYGKFSCRIAQEVVGYGETI